MSLLDEMLSKCVFMNKSKVPDGEGGVITTWTEGAEFYASIAIESSQLALVAEAIKANKTYNIVIDKGITLEVGDVIKRLDDGAIFKITSDSVDKTTPASSRLNKAQVTATRWELTQ